MLEFFLLTMSMGVVVMLSATRFASNQMNMQQVVQERRNTTNITDFAYDEVRPLPQTSRRKTQPLDELNEPCSELLAFTRTAQRSPKQLPLLGMLDKGFYQIH